MVQVLTVNALILHAKLLADFNGYVFRQTIGVVHVDETMLLVEQRVSFSFLFLI